jgi:hypothetical protein
MLHPSENVNFYVHENMSHNWWHCLLQLNINWWCGSLALDQMSLKGSKEPYLPARNWNALNCIFISRIYKVVQIWPGLFVCKQVTACPGHIWTTLYLCACYCQTYRHNGVFEVLFVVNDIMRNTADELNVYIE